MYINGEFETSGGGGGGVGDMKQFEKRFAGETTRIDRTLVLRLR